MGLASAPPKMTATPRAKIGHCLGRRWRGGQHKFGRPDHVTVVRLRARAAGNECSSEEEALNLLRFALVEHGIWLPPPKVWVLAIRERFKPLGIVDVIVPPRSTGEPMQWIFAEDDDEWEKNNPIPAPDEELADELRIRALANDCSVEEEALNVLRFALEKPARLPQPKDLGVAINELFRDLGFGIEVRPRSENPDPVVRYYWLDDGDDR